MNAPRGSRSIRGGTALGVAPPFARIVSGDARKATWTGGQAVTLRLALEFAK